jgi:hypothetical protein
MKQHTDEIQTAKLIELGFERPFRNEYLHIVEEYGYAVNKERNFSIGELIEMLPISFENENDDTSWLEIEAGAVWSVSYSSFGFIDYDCERKELIDALFDMIVKLKEEGVI